MRFSCRQTEILLVPLIPILPLSVHEDFIDRALLEMHEPLEVFQGNLIYCHTTESVEEAKVEEGRY